MTDTRIEDARARRPSLPRNAPHILVAVLITHVVMRVVMDGSRFFIVWDSDIPNSNMALRIMYAVRPVIWPATGAMCLVAICCIVLSMGRRRTLVPNIAPADAAAGLLLLSWATLTYAMHHATAMNPMIRIAGNPLIHLPAFPAYVLLWTNNLRGRTSPRWERAMIAIIGLPTLFALIMSMFNIVGWVAGV